MIGPLGWSELLILFFIILIIFGPRKLPEVAEAFGKSIQKFKKASREAREEIEVNLDSNEKEEKNLKK
ncbi:MAG: twin-arginine translocase TatA/TatE family subunit [Candidatus Latescibacteria bacterium]|nr:twin-arginine translocase TatA/TatE family subunit [Candidatus Latescibacterota bacterium]NIM21032.1 twin-arginine translocase TatA/TatE family subunit [Candidatus Latescibacterota bacterium]NIM65167.1 twin-arginine translocase TatA/TatE family subunit [Candidatus Latescibacterota bacterium]NIO01682.1 twin-arginine translocase TatA/TatE family subunit [Candidatus Latescibacterota bacterium]NIO28199.1 twin-arginine translocase TatA/TatE family subunit [Candidatus Latescibacterota bacterium]